MKFLTALLLLASAVNCGHLILGDSTNKSLVFHTVAEYYAIPLVVRDKSVFYSSPDQKIINSITAYDRLQSQATATVTAGGIGFTYVNLLLKSERGKGLEYDISVYS